jgi:hypothetical protein
MTQDTTFLDQVVSDIRHVYTKRTSQVFENPAGNQALPRPGAVSGVLGSLVGNQGGIRSLAMLGFDVPRRAFVATATAVGLIVDGARLPV